MAIIYPRFLKVILDIHGNLQNEIPYPYFDSACAHYEALRSVHIEGNDVQSVIRKYGLTDYSYRKGLLAFQQFGVPGLIGLDCKQLTEELPIETERMVFVFKKARPRIPATKMVTLLKGFNQEVPLQLMHHLYASYGWATGTKSYKEIDFWSLNLKVTKLRELKTQPLARKSFLDNKDRLQILLEVFRTMETRGITNRYPGSRVSLRQRKLSFLSIGLLGLVDRARSPFRNSKLGFAEEGRIVLSKIQNPEKKETHYLEILKTKKIEVASTCLTNIFTRWKVERFESQFTGDLERFLKTEDDDEYRLPAIQEQLPKAEPIRLDAGFISLVRTLDSKPIPLANPGIFLFLPYLNKLRIYEKASSLIRLDPSQGYSWFSLLLLNLGRTLEGISSNSKACRTSELSLPLSAGLVAMPCNDSLLNGLATIDELALLQLRQFLTQAGKQNLLIEGKRIAFDFKTRDFTGDDINLKNIGKGPSPKRKICFPGFRPHIAWDVNTGAPIAIEFRNGKKRATTTIKRFVQELIQQPLGKQAVEHVYIDSEYTAEHVWQFIVDPEDGMGADLTMCIKQNKRVKKIIQSFLETDPDWLYYDDDHTYSKQTFDIPIRETKQILRCVLKRKESSGKLRCFGSTLKNLDSKGILREYKCRWTIENGIKDLVINYFFDNVPGIDPHRINIHYFVVSLARILFEMFCQDYQAARNSDQSKKTLDTLRTEFMSGSNATLSRVNGMLVLRWEDHYPENQHQVLNDLFHKLNEKSQEGLQFLGGLKLRFEIAPPRSKKFKNICKRKHLEY